MCEDCQAAITILLDKDEAIETQWECTACGTVPFKKQASPFPPDPVVPPPPPGFFVWLAGIDGVAVLLIVVVLAVAACVCVGIAHGVCL